MPLNSYKFISPSVQIKEYDRSILKKPLRNIGPVIIGRAERGPGLVPVTVDSYLEFVEKFGTPSKGLPGSDVWRGRRYYFSNLWFLRRPSIFKE